MHSHPSQLKRLMEIEMTTDESFQKFWQAYPHRMAKLAARRAFDRAIKVATLEVILTGVKNYVASKPEHIAYCHPATWLNGGRWDDCPAPEPKPQIHPTIKASLLRDRIKDLDEKMTYLKGQRPLSPHQARAFQGFKQEREEKSQELRRMI